MNTNPFKSLTVALAAIAALNFSGLCHAQAFKFYGQSSRGLADPAANVTISASEDIGKNVYAIDNLADQMAFRFGWELKFSKDSKASGALYDQMKKHADITNDLIKAYRGKGGISFQTAALAVRNSVSELQSLRRGTKVSEAVSNMISQSIPLVAYVSDNAGKFSPQL